MKKYITVVGCLALAVFLAGCDQKVAPVRQGAIWKVVWSEAPSTQMALFRVTPAPKNSFGEYGVEMSGKLYPTFLEVQRAGASHVQIIPMSQILQLEFGE
jgi:hypothetical protein